LDARELEEFLLEALAMLNGPVLLSVGVSTVNDLLESARKAEGRSFCTRAHDEVESWCTLVKASTSASSASAAPPAPRAVGNSTRTAHKAKASVKAKAKAKAKTQSPKSKPKSIVSSNATALAKKENS
jgi:hypothetical protein